METYPSANFTRAFKGPSPDTDSGARPPVALRGKQGAVHPVVLDALLQETLVDGVQVGRD